MNISVINEVYFKFTDQFAWFYPLSTFSSPSATKSFEVFYPHLANHLNLMDLILA